MSAVLPQGFVRNPDLHAYMFVSPDKAARRDVSKLIAKSILCRNRGENADPCGKCDCCIKMDAKMHPDCIVVDADEKTGVDNIRDVVSEAYLATNEADFKVFILEDADEYNPPSQNALLKIIEEPPRGVRFVLTASSQGAILPTVRSRVCSVSGAVKDIDSIIKDMKKAKPALSDEQIKALSYFVEGYEKADIKSLDEAKIFDYINKAHLFLSGKDTNILMSLPLKREELMLCLQVFMLSVRQLALSKATGKMTEGVLDASVFSQCNAKVSMKRAHALYDLFEESYLLAEGYANVNAVLGYLFENVK